MTAAELEQVHDRDIWQDGYAVGFGSAAAVVVVALTVAHFMPRLLG